MRTYLTKTGKVVRSNGDLPYVIIDIAQTLITLIPKIIGLFGKKYEVPKYIDKVYEDFSDRYFLTLKWSDHGVSIGYYADLDYLESLIEVFGETEKAAKKGLYEALKMNRYIV